MTDFFEKLKKGMDTKNVPDIPEVPKVPDISEVPDEPTEDQPKIESVEPDLAITSIEDEVVEEPKKKPKRKKKVTKKKTEKDKKPAMPEKKKIEIKEPSVESFGETIEEVKIDNGEKDLFADEFGELTIDLYQTDKEVVIQSVIAGVGPEDLDINIEDDLITIKGKREKKFAQEKKNYFYQECYWGQFSREIILPVEVDSSRIEASMDQGVLTIRIPKIGTETKKKIIIKT